MRLFLIIAAVVGAIFVFLTPPFEVPDETAHYWRACAIAQGVLQPAPEYGGQGFTGIPAGERELGIRGGAPLPETRARMREDWAIRYVPERVIVRYPLSLSPLPFLPQAVGIAIGNALKLRPMVSFYLGRLLNLAACLAIVALALRVFRDSRWILTVCALFPMTLFMFASFSPDAMTIAVSFLAIALALAGSPWLIAVTLILALCKAYLLVPLLGIVALRRSWKLTLIGAVVAGVFIAGSFAKTSGSDFRPDVDVGKQTAFLKAHPAEVATTIANDVVHRGLAYGEQMIGTLAWLSIPLPKIVTLSIVALLVLVALFAAPRLTPSQRALAAVIALATIVTIEVSEYIAWTAVGANTVDGVQGRYFIPIAPLLVLAISRGPSPRGRGEGARRADEGPLTRPLATLSPLTRGEGTALAIAVVMAVANVVAIVSVWGHYFRF